MMLFKSGVKVILILLLFRNFQELIRGFGPVGGGVIIQNTHVMNTVRPLYPEVSDEETPLQISLFL